MSYTVAELIIDLIKTRRMDYRVDVRCLPLLPGVEEDDRDITGLTVTENRPALQVSAGQPPGWVTLETEGPRG